MNDISLQQRDRIDVIDEKGEQRVVYGWATVQHGAFVRGSNPAVEQINLNIYAGDSGMKPEAVTHWLAEEIEAQYQTDVRELGIDVINPRNSEVEVL